METPETYQHFKPHGLCGCLLMLCTLLYGQQHESISKKATTISTARPNVIIINVDDLGYGDLGYNGAIKVKTPNIDMLAKQGRVFTDFHSASAVCSPSRYALMTGEYPSRKNFWGALFLKEPLVIDTHRLTIASIMKQAGYATAAVGKWHLGFGNEKPVNWNNALQPGPLELGFDYYFGVPVLNSHAPFVYVENHAVVGLDPSDPFVYDMPSTTQAFPEKFDMKVIGGATRAHALYKDRMLATTLKDTAINWIKKNKHHPFFLYYATTNIHHPFTPAERFVGTSQAGRYGDFIHELDWIIGELMQTLDQEGLRDNSLLIFTSDNGGMLNQGGQDAWKAGHHMNDNFLGFKFDAWEGGHHVPFIARWPGNIPAGTRSGEILSNVDLCATMAALVGYELKTGEAPDSYNALAALLGRPPQPIRDFLVISPNQPKNLAIRQGDWMYISAQDGGGFTGTAVGDHDLGGAAATLFTGELNSDIENGKIKPGAAPAQLYNLRRDPKQTKNVYNDHPEKVKELKALLHEAIFEKQATRKD